MVDEAKDAEAEAELRAVQEDAAQEANGHLERNAHVRTRQRRRAPALSGMITVSGMNAMMKKEPR